jgi:hypothetical protein
LNIRWVPVFSNVSPIVPIPLVFINSTTNAKSDDTLTIFIKSPNYLCIWGSVALENEYGEVEYSIEGPVTEVTRCCLKSCTLPIGGSYPSSGFLYVLGKIEAVVFQAYKNGGNKEQPLNNYTVTTFIKCLQPNTLSYAYPCSQYYKILTKYLKDVEFLPYYYAEPKYGELSEFLSSTSQFEEMDSWYLGFGFTVGAVALVLGLFSGAPEAAMPIILSSAGLDFEIAQNSESLAAYDNNFVISSPINEQFLVCVATSSYSYCLNGFKFNIPVYYFRISSTQVYKSYCTLVNITGNTEYFIDSLPNYIIFSVDVSFHCVIYCCTPVENPVTLNVMFGKLVACLYKGSNLVWKNTYKENGHQVLICIPKPVICSNGIGEYKLVVKYEGCMNDTIATLSSCADMYFRVLTPMPR